MADIVIADRLILSAILLVGVVFGFNFSRGKITRMSFSSLRGFIYVALVLFFAGLVLTIPVENRVLGEFKNSIFLYTMASLYGFILVSFFSTLVVFGVFKILTEIKEWWGHVK